MRRNVFRKGIVCLVLLGLCALLSSCDMLLGMFADIDVDGHIYYTGDQVNYIEFTVSGGTGTYDIYYSKSSCRDEDDAARISGKSFVGTAEKGKTYTLSVSGYRSTGWYYHIWAVDEYGATGHARWHP